MEYGHIYCKLNHFKLF